MTAQADTKLQVNFKLADGTLINLYATNGAELEAQLNTIADTAALITSTSAAFGNSGGTAYAAAALGGTVVSSTPSQTSSVIEEGHCKHGKLVYRTSKPGAPKEWKGWFCPSPQGTADQCSPKFIR
jgi:hypothetical protein